MNENSIILDETKSDNKGSETQQNSSIAAEKKSSSLLERIRAQQQKKTDATPIKTAQNLVKPLSLSSNNDTNFSGSKHSESESFLPKLSVPSNRNTSNSLQQSIFPPASTTLKQDSSNFNFIAQTAPYAYASTLNPPIQTFHPSTKYGIATQNQGRATKSFTDIFDSMKKGMSSITNKMTTPQDPSPYQDALLGDNSIHNEEKNPVEPFEYSDMDGNVMHVMDDEDYSMKEYFITFCNDMHTFTLGRLNSGSRKVIFVTFLVYFLWVTLKII